MRYTVKQLSEISGVTVRTLHFYEEIGILKPAYYGSNGYRYYEEQQLLQLQQILFFKELGFSLKQIWQVVGRSDFDQLAALHSHRNALSREWACSNNLNGRAQAHHIAPLCLTCRAQALLTLSRHHSSTPVFFSKIQV
ncbi:MAG: MerR family transcriptional regulator [Chlamydiae bacterium]|nr:MerR family transcriptional regulator [Chlamydiota bacterium]